MLVREKLLSPVAAIGDPSQYIAPPASASRRRDADRCKTSPGARPGHRGCSPRCTFVPTAASAVAVAGLSPSIAASNTATGTLDAYSLLALVSGEPRPGGN